MSEAEEDGSLPLLIQAIDSNRNEKEIEQILKNGADVNLKCGEHGDTPLHRVKNKNLIKLLIDYGADVNSRDDCNMTPLIKAVFLEKMHDIISEFLKYGADVNSTDTVGNTALHFAYSKEIVNILISYGAVVNVKDKNGIVPLMKAVMEEKDIDVINSILSNGANPYSQLQIRGSLALIHYSKSVSHVNMYMWYNADIDATVKGGADTFLIKLIIEYCHTTLTTTSYTRKQFTSKIYEIIKPLMKHSLLINGEKLYKYFFLTLTCSNMREDYCGSLDEIIAFLQNLKSELKLMKKFRITKRFSLFDFCVSYYKNYKIPIKNTDLHSFIYNDNDSNRKCIVEHFPLYYDIIIMIIKIYKNKYKLLKNLTRLSICNNNNMDGRENYKVIHLNYDCLQCIAYYLDYRDLVNLFLASRKIHQPIYKKN
ncbi:uncharacterized protein LOC142328401 [Lycorma delicatula]|uniref:uncharacterized protein LOC142328401 n=1 Tax=Lycorma delicatula TaxID=130591 RepID=UPI003F517510